MEIYVVGPTASGKSDIAIEIAQRFGGEVISADSMQIYRELNVGTAKVTEKEKTDYNHGKEEEYTHNHQWQYATPWTTTASHYQADTAKAIQHRHC